MHATRAEYPAVVELYLADSINIAYIPVCWHPKRWGLKYLKVVPMPVRFMQENKKREKHQKFNKLNRLKRKKSRAGTNIGENSWSSQCFLDLSLGFPFSWWTSLCDYLEMIKKRDEIVYNYEHCMVIGLKLLAHLELYQEAWIFTVRSRQLSSNTLHLRTFLSITVGLSQI